MPLTLATQKSATASTPMGFNYQHDECLSIPLHETDKISIKRSFQVYLGVGFARC